MPNACDDMCEEYYLHKQANQAQNIIILSFKRDHFLKITDNYSNSFDFRKHH